MNNEPDYDNLYFEPKAKGTLTEQWKRGELPEGWYYVIKTGDVEMLEYCCDCFLAGDVPLIDNEVTGVLAPVPSYDEWKAAQEQLHKEGVWYTEISHKKVLKENAQLKELLKECKEVFDTVFSPSVKYGELYKQIDEVLK